MAETNANRKVHIVGIGEDGWAGLTEHARRLIESADVVLGAEVALDLLGDTKAQKVPIGTDLDEALRRVESAGEEKLVVLASGDPLFYGVARYLCDQLGKERFEIVPHVSSMQLAFARVKESWEEAYLTDLSSRPLADVVDRIRTAEKVGVFTSAERPPAEVARALLTRGVEYFTAYVCENLGMPNERVTHAELAEIAGMEFGPLNVLILVRKPDFPDRPREKAHLQLLGNPDDVFAQSKPKQGLLTSAEVRAIALAQLNIRPRSTVWDVGAGSGSVAIEAAQLASQGRVYAVEKDLDDYRLILANAETFGVSNLEAVHGRAPEALARLPRPDAVFIGGTGHEVGGIAEAAYGRLRDGGRLVVAVSSIESLAAVHAMLRRREGEVGVWMINVARGTYQLERIRFDALNPTFLLAIEKHGRATSQS